MPKLRKINYKNRKHTYKLKFTAKKRRLAIDEGVEMEKKKTGKTKEPPLQKKEDSIYCVFIENIRNQKMEILTRDMKYMDRKYKLGKQKYL